MSHCRATWPRCILSGRPAVALWSGGHRGQRGVFDEATRRGSVRFEKEKEGERKGCTGARDAGRCREKEEEVGRE
ncbi:hypothetical protein PBY51_009387 [Eleginops maclovinus]|uniref:Uncharacterized protein n=1 Tax=Eleginops maclovinus TaxID=56733 RepID=A0AAN8AMQ5_ELEMC|nr:hypothetical protein PBY51_009387 [Eleginops maclovinus]